VSNSTPLIFLAKIGKIHLLENIFERILIPEEVYSEVVVKGKERGHVDSTLIEELVKKGFILIKEAKTTVLKDAPIEEGEKSAISLALRENIQEILIDEGKVRRMAKVLGLRPRGTLWILSRFYEEDLISKREFKESIFDMLSKGYRIKEEILIEILKELEG
jgi:predicted nucleic acid-binding protein